MFRKIMNTHVAWPIAFALVAVAAVAHMYLNIQYPAWF